MADCPVCKTPLAGVYNLDHDATRCDCPRCGEFDAVDFVVAVMERDIDKKPHRRALISHKLSRASGGKQRPQITRDNLDELWREDRLPSPLQQEIDLLLYIGDHQQSAGTPLRVSRVYVAAWIGTALGDDDLNWLEGHLYNRKLISEYAYVNDPGFGIYQLTLDGWTRYAELKRQQPDTRIGFMAMKFGDAELDSAVANCFKPAVASTGFELRVLTDQQPAGLIDNQLRAALVGARFVVADLSHGNNGAYWEAGFAEGLGRPVIYTCKKAVWDVQKTHFDTNHMTTIVWEPANLSKAGADLAATIRNTFRADAKQE